MPAEAAPSRPKFCLQHGLSLAFRNDTGYSNEGIHSRNFAHYGVDGKKVAQLNLVENPSMELKGIFCGIIKHSLRPWSSAKVNRRGDI
jgi:hypothetical protein